MDGKVNPGLAKRAQTMRPEIFCLYIDADVRLRKDAITALVSNFKEEKIMYFCAALSYYAKAI